MPRLSAVDCVGPAFKRVGAVLLPFRLSNWIKMGFIGWLAGGVVTVSANFRGPVLPREFPGAPNDPFKDLNDAIRLMSKHPGVKAGPFEIRPAEDLSEIMCESERRRSRIRGE